MVLKLRLARIKTPGGARRHHPRYNIVLAHARTARDSKPLEVLGTYNPIPQTPVGAEPGARQQKDIKVDVSRAKYWLGVGAQPSDTMWRLLSMVRLKFLSRSRRGSRADTDNRSGYSSPDIYQPVRKRTKL
nr:ribosomal protein s16, mitochondrial [Quercus suber]